VVGKTSQFNLLQMIELAMEILPLVVY